MQFTVQIPDHLAVRLAAAPGDLPRRALEALAADEFRTGHLTKPELRQLLAFDTGNQIDRFLKAHGVFEQFTLAGLEQELQTLRRLGI